mmetsp:Transcript_47059/g.117387  ORF Transcript_47059/g.117387 Transcript_47059/m.117387 type:complete len:239 (-) Transcript_47059:2176-2892(-)
MSAALPRARTSRRKARLISLLLLVELLLLVLVEHARGDAGVVLDTLLVVAAIVVEDDAARGVVARRHVGHRAGGVLGGEEGRHQRLTVQPLVVTGPLRELVEVLPLSELGEGRRVEKAGMEGHRGVVGLGDGQLGGREVAEAAQLALGAALLVAGGLLLEVPLALVQCLADDLLQWTALLTRTLLELSAAVHTRSKLLHAVCVTTRIASRAVTLEPVSAHVRLEVVEGRPQLVLPVSE